MRPTCREFAALYYMEDKQSFYEALHDKIRLFSQGKVTLKGLDTASAEKNHMKHAEKMLFQEFRKINKYNEFDQSRMPDTKAMILMDKIKEFAESG